MTTISRILVLAAVSTLALTANSQGKYGATPEDSITCITNLSLYQEFIKQNSINDAYGPWKKVLQVCPTASKGAYQNAPRILGTLIANEKDAERVRRLKDSLYLVYDLRIQYFGDECFVLGRKGMDMLQYDPDNCEAAFNVLEQGLAACGGSMEAVAIQSYYQALECMYNEGKATKDRMLSDYVVLMGYIEANLARPNLRDADRVDNTAARDNLNTMFFKVAECADIGRIAGDMVKAKPGDMEVRTRLLRVLNGKDCTEEPIYRTLAEEVHKASPTSESAYSLGMNLVKRNDLSGASKYLKEAVELCTNCPDKVTYLLKAGQVASAMGSHSTARSYANQILQLEPKNGEAILLIGDAILSQAGSCEKPQSWGVYWLAYDQYQRARSVDPSVSDKAGDKMGRTSPYFPLQTDAFFYQLSDGQSFQVTCGGLNEGTTVRTRK